MPTHAERRVLPYTPEQLFDIVADIERYPDFLPWCVAARVRSRDGNLITADVVIGFKMFRERFTTRNVLDRPRRIDVTYHEGPFKYLNNHWLFEPVGEGSCDLDFYIDFEFRSRAVADGRGGALQRGGQGHGVFLRETGQGHIRLTQQPPH